MKQLIHFLFEVGMLKKTPRTGYQFLGTGRESVADHCFRTAIIGYALARALPEADVQKTVFMCLFHDLHEARTGDHNYVNKQYVKVDEEKAVADLAENLAFGQDLISLTDEFNRTESLEARLARDADQLDLMFELKGLLDVGNRNAADWLHFARQRLVTETGRQMADELLRTDSTDWWFQKKTELWVNGGPVPSQGNRK
jgi:putative hydrolase of HD superfamily